MRRLTFAVFSSLMLLALFQGCETQCTAATEFDGFGRAHPVVVASLLESQPVRLDDAPLLEACCFARLPLNVAVTLLILLMNAFVLIILFVVLLITFLSRRSQSKKLEPALRAALTERDSKKAAYLCDLYNSAPPAPIISSMIARSEAVEPSALVNVEELKRVWLSTAGTEFSQWMRPAELAHWIRIIVIFAPVLSLLPDISRSLKGFDLISGEGNFSLYWVLWRGLPLLSCGMFLAILAFALERITSRQAIKQKFTSDDFAIEFLLNYVGKSRRQGPPGYKPGSWMSSVDPFRTPAMRGEVGRLLTNDRGRERTQ